MKTYGMMDLVSIGRVPHWRIEGKPHMLMMLKRVFIGLGGQFKTLRVDATPSNCETLEWFLQRYPLEMSERDRAHLESTVTEARRRRHQCEEILLNAAAMPKLPTKLPLREYQQLGVHLLLASEGLLIGDDLGLGKTAIALGAAASGLSPAIIVCQTHLQEQWQDEALKFLHDPLIHIVKSGKPYDLPRHNILIVPYSKLKGWGDTLEGYRLVVFDECQELRHSEGSHGKPTAKYGAAQAVARGCGYRLGLSATPIYNYGDEIFNILEVLQPGRLGTLAEFRREWCSSNGRHHIVDDPEALGSFLAEQHLFLRRRRREVGRELPPVTRVVEDVEYHRGDLLAREDHILQLAKTILNGSWQEKGKASLELDAMLRMQTGIAKAPFVVEFVKQMVESGEKVVLCGWHREVYEVWQRLFSEAGIYTVLYTGSESPAMKQRSKDAFVNGDAKVFILSLRSGAGLNELQLVSEIIVFGELDWSPQVHEQAIGRLQRDDQKGAVTAIFLVAAGGADPVIAKVCGVKKSQSDGIIDPGVSPAIFDQQASIPRAAALARHLIGDIAGLKAA